MTTPVPVTALYHRLIDAWNQRDAAAMAACFAPEGTMIGFDGSTACGPGPIRDHLAPVFRDHPTAAFITVVRENRALGRDVSMLRAIVGMLPLGASDINPATNATQCLVATLHHGGWLVDLFQNTPAAYHGRPHEQEAHTEAIRAALRACDPTAP